MQNHRKKLFFNLQALPLSPLILCTKKQNENEDKPATNGRKNISHLDILKFENNEDKLINKL